MPTEWEREQRRVQAEAEFEAREEEVSRGNAAIESELAKLDSVLMNSVRFARTLDYGSRLVDVPDIASIPTPVLEPEPLERSFLPSEPSGLMRAIPGSERRYSAKYEIGQLQYQAAHLNWQRAVNEQKLRYERQVAEIREAAATAINANELLRRHQADAPTGARKSVEDFILWALNSNQYLVTIGVAARYLPSRKELLLELEYPNVDDVIPQMARWDHVTTRKAVKVTPRTKEDRNRRYKQLIAQVTLAALYQCFHVDKYIHIEKISFKGFVRGVSPITGRPVQPAVVSYRVLDRAGFLDRNFSQVEAYKLLKSFRANISDQPTELKAVPLIIEFDISDPRLIEEEDIISQMDDRDNLLDLTPSQFEGVITNLFNRMGYEAFPTVRSKDGGIDCIAYLRNPVSVFKCVIQAKQWTVPVGVNAIRDLAGAMDHERASQGILVTTCRVTTGGWQFAEGKPLQIIEGNELLDLFEKYTDRRVTIVFPPPK